MTGAAASPATCDRSYADGWIAPLVAALVALDGVPCPSNAALARLLDLSAGQLDHALARAIGQGRVVREMRARSRRLSVPGADGRVIAATGWSRAGGNIVPAQLRDAAAMAARAAASGSAAAKSARAPAPPPPRAVNLRCPLCNLPPDHADCRHGWNGQTIRAERRAIVAEMEARP